MTGTHNEKAIVVTVQGNYSAAEIDANPQLADQAELDITFQSQTGQILYSRTYTAQNYNMVAPAAMGTSIDPASCYIDCMVNFGYLDDWPKIYVTALGIYASYFAETNLVGALLGVASIIGVHTGCFYGCLAAWIWFG